jgi:pimeloyl-ACP methyl ester carboxylesterase
MAIVEGPDVRRVSTSYGEVRVRDTGGDGPPVLLVHSLLFDPDLYRDLAPLLHRAGLRCVVPELPLGGHGVPLRADADLSPTGLAGLLVEVLDGLGLDRVDVVGVDTGGALVQLLMADHRTRVDRVVLTGCDAYEEFPPTTPLARLFPAAVLAGAARGGGAGAAAATGAPAADDPAPDPPRARRRRRRPAHRAAAPVGRPP